MEITKIHVTNMNLHYGDFHALKNINIDIPENQICAMIGPSGCGKSMTFKAIAGIETPDSGKICLGKRELFHRGHKVNLPPRKRSVGYLFQSYALFPNMTVFQNIEAGIQGKKAAKRERAMEMMEKFHLSELASGYPARLSGGQQQRVGIARALAADAKILLMDEPFGALDEITKRAMQNEMLSLQKQLHMTIVFITHDIQEAMKLGDRVLVMEKGRIAQLGTPREIQEHPADDFVRELTQW